MPFNIALQTGRHPLATNIASPKAHAVGWQYPTSDSKCFVKGLPHYLSLKGEDPSIPARPTTVRDQGRLVAATLDMWLTAVTYAFTTNKISAAEVKRAAAFRDQCNDLKDEMLARHSALNKEVATGGKVAAPAPARFPKLVESILNDLRAAATTIIDTVCSRLDPDSAREVCGYAAIALLALSCMALTLGIVLGGIGLVIAIAVAGVGFMGANHLAIRVAHNPVEPKVTSSERRPGGSYEMEDIMRGDGVRSNGGIEFDPDLYPPNPTRFPPGALIEMQEIKPIRHQTLRRRMPEGLNRLVCNSRNDNQLLNRKPVIRG